MSKQIFIRYIHEMYGHLLSMGDDEIADFYINAPDCRATLFDAMKADFDTYGPISKQRLLDAIEFILLSNSIDKYWGAAVPHAVPLDEINDKPGYLSDLYEKLAGHKPMQKRFDPDVEIIKNVGPSGIDVRE